MERERFLKEKLSKNFSGVSEKNKATLRNYFLYAPLDSHENPENDWEMCVASLIATLEEKS